MMALRWHGRGDVRLDDVPPPGRPADGELQVEVGACGICGTDVEEWREGPFMIPVGEPHPITGVTAPITLGHELAGSVIAVGSGTGSWAVGDRIAVDGLVSCGDCQQCARGRPNLCWRMGQVGLMRDGGLQPVVNVPAAACLRLPDGVDMTGGALAETLSVGIRALRRGRFVAGEKVAVVGGGAVGLLALQAARALGAAGVTLVEPVAFRRRLGEDLGAETVVHPDRAEGIQADIVLECGGSASSVTTALAVTASAGRTVLLGVSRATPPLPVWETVLREKEIIGSLSHVIDHDYAAALGLLAAGGISYEALVTSVALEDALEGGLRALAERPDRYLKIVIRP
jgi:(R,R)-butanediol dehydrogenase / meso-butanediol dehydrogenase / diacetyl reductase